MILIKNRLNAGLFSNLNAVVGWYWYSMRTGTPAYIDWDGVPNQNIFDYFFIQKHKYEYHQYENNANFQHSPLYTDQIKEAFKEDIGELMYNKYDTGWFLCKGEVYTEPDFLRLRNLYNYIYTENLKLKTELIPTIDIPQKTLGVNYRYIKMYFTNDGKMTPFKDIMSLEEYHKKYLDQMEFTFENGKYEKIYVASSHRVFFDKCIRKFKDKILYIPLIRLEEDLWEIHRNVSLEKEYRDVLSDVLNLSKCDHLVISPSNIVFSLLYMNTNITYDVFEFLKDVFTG